LTGLNEGDEVGYEIHVDEVRGKTSAESLQLT
jgi:CspA family cold shock protein